MPITVLRKARSTVVEAVGSELLFSSISFSQHQPKIFIIIIITMQCLPTTVPSSSMSPLSSFLSCLLQEHRCTSFSEVVVDNPRPNWQDRPSLKITLTSAAATSTFVSTTGSDLPGASSSFFHSTARWKSNETTATSSHSTKQTESQRGLIPVVRKASPIVKPHSTVCSGIPTCPIRKLSQETSLDNDGHSTVLLYPMQTISVSPESAELGITIDDDIHNESNTSNPTNSPHKPLTLSEALKLPVYRPLEEHRKKNKKSTDSTVSSASSAGSGSSKPPLSPKKRSKIKITTLRSGSKSTAKDTVVTAEKHDDKAKTLMMVKPFTTMAAFQATTPSTLHSTTTKQANSETSSPSSNSSSPRSITDYDVALRPRPDTGRRSLSKTLGVDFQETAPIQPMRRPSSEPEQHHVVVLRRPTPPRLQATRALIRRQSSTISACSSGSTSSSVFSDGSQSSSNSDTIATFPSFCSNTSASEATVKVKNGLSRNVTAGDDRTNTVTTAVTTTTAPKTRSFSFLPTPLEQVSEQSISEHSGSTATTTSPTVSNRKMGRDMRHGDPPSALFIASDPGVEIEFPPLTAPTTAAAAALGNRNSNNINYNVDPKSNMQREIVFRPPSSPSALPVDHESIVDRFEEGSPSDGKPGRSTFPGRFMRIWKTKFR